ncbi:MAG: TonB family protein [Candidatus Endonucleobacter bathymodioli]|uniref:TonB family protein n=1 Tax=Candidatus Endonucleibacter bathymodioli TaxID=539814 RepID=A0AA90SWW3_9GAMM|nr:TonB family protein [Candidatus Endonucleobacter bathymodioli]
MCPVFLTRAGLTQGFAWLYSPTQLIINAMSRKLLFTLTLSILVHIASAVYFNQQENPTMVINTGSIQTPVRLTISTVSDLAGVPQPQVGPEPLPKYLLVPSAEKSYQKPYIDTELTVKRPKSNHKKQIKKEKTPIKKTFVRQSNSVVEEPIQKKAIQEKAIQEKAIQEKAIQAQPKNIQRINTSPEEHIEDVFSRSSMLITSPSIVRMIQPKYPKYCRHKHIEGTTHLEIEIDETGKITIVTILKSSGFEQLDRSALAAVKQWIFKPAQHHNTCIKSTVRQPVSFQIKPVSELGST